MIAGATAATDTQWEVDSENCGRDSANPFATPVRKRKTTGKADTMLTPASAGAASTTRSPSVASATTPARSTPTPSAAMSARVYSSSYHGVSMHKGSQRWHAQVRFQGKRISLGYYEDELVAAQAYDKVSE